MSIVSQRIISNRVKRIEAHKISLQKDLRKAVEILINNYSAKRIILFGSLTTGKIRESSDIDLVVEGLGNQFLNALGHCMRECETNIDIKPLEELTPQFKGAVLEKGKIIYESEK